MAADTPPAATTDHETVDVCVVGSGIAGCAAALAAARAGADVLVLTKAEKPADASTDWAQGGISTTRGEPETLKEDILAASDGTADSDAVDVLVSEADDAVSDVLVYTLGIEFDRYEGGEFEYTREAAHSTFRILHVDASTGSHVLRPFLNYVDDHDRIEVRQDAAALELITHEGLVCGVVSDEAEGGYPVYAGSTVLATGGIGSLYTRSTNPPGSTGDGIAMAALAGADVADLEYVQFHPTAFAGGGGRNPSNRNGGTAEAGEALRASNRSGAERSSADRSSGQRPREDGEAAETGGSSAAERENVFLLSEALRGEGAVLVNGAGERFMPDYHERAELGPRDVVARAVQAERERTGEVVLDVSTLEEPFEELYPDLAAKCRERDVEGDEIPVAPCEHFLCGGIDVDAFGRTSLDGLYAVGECARSGVHGANRLASTSLLEGLVWGLRAGEDAASAVEDGRRPQVVETPDLLTRDPDLPPRFAAEKFTRLRRTMDECLGLERDPDQVARAGAVLRRLKGEVDAYTRTRTSRDLYELRNACVTALLIARAARENTESAGCHHVVTDAEGTAAEANGPVDD